MVCILRQALYYVYNTMKCPGNVTIIFYKSILTDQKKKKIRDIKKNKKSTAPGIPRRSPIQVLTGPDVA